MNDDLKSIINAFHDLIFVFDKDGTIKEYISKNHENELILPKNSFLEKNYHDVLPPNVSNKLSQAFQELDQGREQYKFDYRLELEGKEQWYTAVISNISHRENASYLGVVRNITERKDREFLLQGILNTSPGGIMVLQTIRNSSGEIMNFVVTQINKSVEKLTGISEKELIGQNITKVISEEYKEYIFELCKEALESGSPVEFQYQQRNQKSQEAWYYCKIAKYQDGVIGNFLNIDNQKKFEAELAAKNKELMELNQQKNKLFSVVSHDLTNSVAGSKGVFEIMIKSFENLSRENIFEYLEMLNQRSNDTYELLQDLLDWSKNQFREVTTDLKKVHLTRLTNTVFDNVKSHAVSKDINLLNQILDDVYVQADVNMIKTVLRNLINNGIKFSNPGGQININAKRMAQEIKISVSDNGIGMNEETQKKVMNRKINFTSTGTSGEKGSGVGLDLCIDFVEKHNGKIWVESELGKGTTFYFTLPEYS